MTAISFWLSWSPVLVLTVLAVGLKRPALSLSIWGTLYTLALVVVLFDTPLSVALLSGLDGVLTTGPLVLVIFAGILLSSLLMASGSLKRIVDWFMGGVRDTFHRSLLISLGVCNFMEGAGVIAEPVVAPMLAAAGVAPAGAAALSIIGYSGLLTLEMAGIIVTVLSLVTGLPIYDLGLASAWLSLPATLAMAACVPFFLPKPRVGARGFALALTAGAVLGIAALLACAYVSVSISGMMAGLVLIAFLVMIGNRSLPLNQQILRDLAPFLLVLVALLLLNTAAPLKDLTFRQLALPVSIIPIHTVTLRPLYSAYLYLFAAFGLAVYLHRRAGVELRAVMAGAWSKGWRASVAMSLFGAMGQIIAFSGYGNGFEALVQANNLPWLMAHGLFDYTGWLYPLFVPFLGWVGTFLTGYGVASLMLFGALQVTTAGLMKVSAVWLSAGLAVGASLGSVSSPFKIAIAAPMCGALGQEGLILRWTIPIGVASSLLVGVILLFLL